LAARTPAQVAREFRAALAAGGKLLPVGSTRRRPRRLLTLGYTPRTRVSLFDASYWLCAPRQNADIRFYVAYVQLASRPRAFHPRIFYKDVSLTWRSASHFVHSDGDNWIGKGEVKTEVVDGVEMLISDEATTDLPLEIQTALEGVCQQTRRFPHDEKAVERILRRGRDDRIAPYHDFVAPRARARAGPRNLLNRGRRIARFTRRGDPTSLRFAAGFEPDFTKRGVVEQAHSRSRLYHGQLRRFRIVSKNRRAQYLFIDGPHQTWIASCQATTTEITSYGVRSIDAHVDDDLLIPGYEYHFMDDSQDPPRLHSQIPDGYAGKPSDVDDSRADTSAWLDQLPVIRSFRKRWGRGNRGRS